MRILFLILFSLLTLSGLKLQADEEKEIFKIAARLNRLAKKESNVLATYYSISEALAIGEKEVTAWLNNPRLYEFLSQEFIQKRFSKARLSGRSVSMEITSLRKARALKAILESDDKGKLAASKSSFAERFPDMVDDLDDPQITLYLPQKSLSNGSDVLPRKWENDKEDEIVRKLNNVAKSDHYLEQLLSYRSIAGAVGASETEVKEWFANRRITGKIDKDFFDRRAVAIERHFAEIVDAEYREHLQHKKLAEDFAKKVNRLAENEKYREYLASYAAIDNVLNLAPGTASTLLNDPVTDSYLSVDFFRKRGEVALLEEVTAGREIELISTARKLNLLVGRPDAREVLKTQLNMARSIGVRPTEVFAWLNFNPVARYFTYAFLALRTEVAEFLRGPENHHSIAKQLNDLALRDDHLKTLINNRSIGDALGFSHETIRKALSNEEVVKLLLPIFFERKAEAAEAAKSNRNHDKAQKKADAINALITHPEFKDIFRSRGNLAEALGISYETTALWLEDEDVLALVDATLLPYVVEMGEKVVVENSIEVARRINEVTAQINPENRSYDLIAERLEVSRSSLNAWVANPLIAAFLSDQVFALKVPYTRSDTEAAIAQWARTFNEFAKSQNRSKITSLGALAKLAKMDDRSTYLWARRAEVWPLLSNDAVDMLLSIDPVMRLNFQIRLQRLAFDGKEVDVLAAENETSIPLKVLKRWLRSQKILSTLDLGKCVTVRLAEVGLPK